jgi:ethanolamine ammonia-lyase small subunit
VACHGLSAIAAAVPIGERPGLSDADSFGVYLTWQPRGGRTNAERNRISNIRPEGFPPAAAADKLLWQIAKMRPLQLTGIALKDAQTVMLPQSVQPPDAALHD